MPKRLERKSGGAGSGTSGAGAPTPATAPTAAAAATPTTAAATPGSGSGAASPPAAAGERLDLDGAEVRQIELMQDAFERNFQAAVSGMQRADQFRVDFAEDVRQGAFISVARTVREAYGEVFKLGREGSVKWRNFIRSDTDGTDSRWDELKKHVQDGFVGLIGDDDDQKRAKLQTLLAFAAVHLRSLEGDRSASGGERQRLQKSLGEMAGEIWRGRLDVRGVAGLVAEIIMIPVKDMYYSATSTEPVSVEPWLGKERKLAVPSDESSGYWEVKETKEISQVDVDGALRVITEPLSRAAATPVSGGSGAGGGEPTFPLDAVPSAPATALNAGDDGGGGGGGGDSDDLFVGGSDDDAAAREPISLSEIKSLLNQIASLDAPDEERQQAIGIILDASGTTADSEDDVGVPAAAAAAPEFDRNGLRQIQDLVNIFDQCQRLYNFIQKGEGAFNQYLEAASHLAQQMIEFDEMAFRLVDENAQLFGLGGDGGEEGALRYQVHVAMRVKLRSMAAEALNRCVALQISEAGRAGVAPSEEYTQAFARLSDVAQAMERGKDAVSPTTGLPSEAADFGAIGTGGAGADVPRQTATEVLRECIEQQRALDDAVEEQEARAAVDAAALADAGAPPPAAAGNIFGSGTLMDEADVRTSFDAAVAAVTSALSLADSVHGVSDEDAKKITTFSKWLSDEMVVPHIDEIARYGTGDLNLVVSLENTAAIMEHVVEGFQTAVDELPEALQASAKKELDTLLFSIQEEVVTAVFKCSRIFMAHKCSDQAIFKQARMLTAWAETRQREIGEQNVSGEVSRQPIPDFLTHRVAGDGENDSVNILERLRAFTVAVTAAKLQRKAPPAATAEVVPTATRAGADGGTVKSVMEEAAGAASRESTSSGGAAARAVAGGGAPASGGGGGTGLQGIVTASGVASGASAHKSWFQNQKAFVINQIKKYNAGISDPNERLGCTAVEGDKSFIITQASGGKCTLEYKGANHGAPEISFEAKDANYAVVAATLAALTFTTYTMSKDTKLSAEQLKKVKAACAAKGIKVRIVSAKIYADLLSGKVNVDGLQTHELGDIDALIASKNQQEAAKAASSDPEAMMRAMQQMQAAQAPGGGAPAGGPTRQQP